VCKYPHRSGQFWLYDDSDLDVYKEPFVLGSSEVIDRIVGEDCESFTMLISKDPIPDYTAKIVRRLDLEIEGMKGWYQLEGTEMTHWLCGHLLDYFNDYPSSIYVKIIIN
jgi:hypothetical protein